MAAAVLRNTVLLAVVGAGVYSALYATPLAFSILTTTVVLLIGFPLEGRRLAFDRPFYFRRPLGTFLFRFFAGFVAVTVLLRAALAGFVALFTFPYVDGLKGTSIRFSELIEAMSFDRGWAQIAFLGTLIFAVCFVLFLERVAGWKGARWSYFRLPLLFGLVYSGTVFMLSDTLDGPTDRGLFPAPSAPEAGEGIVYVFGDYLILEDVVDVFKRLQSRAEDAEAKVEETSMVSEEIVSEATTLIGDFEAFVSALDEINVCQLVGTRYTRDFTVERRWQVGDITLREFEGTDTIRAGSRPLYEPCEVNLLEGRGCFKKLAEKPRVLEQQVWKIAGCGRSTDGIQWCRDVIGQSGNSEWTENATRFANRSGLTNQQLHRQYCSPDTANIDETKEAIAELQCRISPERCGISVPDIVDDPTVTEDGFEGDGTLTFEKSLSILSMLDAFVDDRVGEAIDRSIYWLESRPSFFFSSGNSVPSTSSKPDLALGDTLCELDQQGEIEVNWCGSMAQNLVKIMISPYVLQGLILSVYSSFILLVFQGRDDRGRPPPNWSKIDKLVWDFRGRKKRVQTDLRGGVLEANTKAISSPSTEPKGLKI